MNDFRTEIEGVLSSFDTKLNNEIRRMMTELDSKVLDIKEDLSKFIR